MYYGNNKEYIANDINDNPFASEQMQLEMREALENIKDWFY